MRADEIKMTNEIKHENRVKGVDNSNVFPIVKPLPVLVVASYKIEAYC